MKTLIWTLALIGLAIPCFLSAVSLAGYCIARQQIAKYPGKTGETSILLGPTFGLSVNANAPDLELTSSLVPPIITLVGAIAFLFGLFFLIPRQPLVINTNGFSHLEAHVQRLLQSHSSFASLGLSTPDGQHALGLNYRNRQVTVSLFASVKPPDGQEPLIRRYFALMHIAPVEDYLAGNGGVKGATRILSYPLPGDVQIITKLCKDIFTDIFGVGDRQGIQFDYDEQ